jgi:hypothetical protein
MTLKRTLGKKKKSYPSNRPWRPTWLWDFEAPTFCLGGRFTYGGNVMSLTRRPSLPKGFLALISVRSWVDPRTIARLEGVGQLKTVHLIRTRIRDLPGCSIVPQPSTLRRAPKTKLKESNLWFSWLGSSSSNGRAIAQAVSRWLPTAAARIQTRVWSCGICGGQSGAGADFLRVLRFPFIPPISPQSPLPIIRGWYNRPVVTAVLEVPAHKLKKKK